jgi:short-subunit dehydrogenase
VPGKPVTLITGASAGIGEAFARLFAQRGRECALVARRADKLNELADTIAATGGSRPHVIAADLAERDGPERVARELAERALEPAVVVNNAGFGLAGPAADLSRADQLAMIDLNLRALTDLSLRFIPSLAQHRGGIINIASVAAFFPGPGMAIYFASKAYVLSFSEALSRELAPRGVRVTAVCPGPVPTEFQARAGLKDAQSPFLTVSAEQVARESYEGFVRGKRVVVPGFANKLNAILPRVLPRGLVLRLVGNYQRKAALERPPARP